MRFRMAVAGCVWVLAFAGGAEAQQGSETRVQAGRLAVPIVVDGRLDDEGWRGIPPVSGFVQRQPDEGRPATEPTELRVAYDDDTLYVAARLHDREPAAIVRRLSRRDLEVEADLFTLALDPQHDRLTGVLFTVSAAGVQQDAIIYNDTFLDPTWDA